MDLLIFMAAITLLLIRWVRRVDEQRAVPAIGAFLQFLARDIQAHPDQMQQFSPELLARATALVEGIEVDLDAPIEGEVAI